MKNKIKPIISFILSLFIFISCFTSTVYGATDKSATSLGICEAYNNSTQVWVGIPDLNSNFTVSSSCNLLRFCVNFGNSPSVIVYEGYSIEITSKVSGPSNFMNGQVRLFIEDDFNNKKYYSDYVNVSSSGNSLTYTFNSDFDDSLVYVYIEYKFNSVSNGSFKFIDGQMTIYNVNETSSNTSTNKIGQFFDNLKNSLFEWFNSLFQWLRDIKDNIVSLGSNIGNWFTDLKNNIQTFFNGLGDRISGFFTNLTNDIRERFSDLINNLSTFFSNVGSWFTNLGDSISGFFEKLWNRIYYGNENGASEYQKPIINNKLNDVIDTLDEYQISLKSTIDTIDDTADDVSEYMSNVTTMFNGIINIAGTGFTVLIVFGIVFILVRKVVGR